MSSPPKQSIVSRLFWFGVGGFISVAINWSIYFVFHYQLAWPKWVALAISLTTVTVVFSLWNYFINFRTGREFHECMVRYLAAVGFCYVLNYGIALTGIKQIGHTKLLEFLVLTVVQVLVSGVKFLLYHHWVYPRHDHDESTTEVIAQ